MRDYLLKQPDVISFNQVSGLNGDQSSARGFVRLKPWAQRPLPSQSSLAIAHKATKELGRIERRMGRAAQVIESLHARMEQVAADPARVGELAGLGRELATAEAEHEALEEAWLEAAEVLEN